MYELVTGNRFLVLMVLVFLAFLMLLEAGYVFWRARRGPEAVRLRQRLSGVAGTAANPVLLRQRSLMRDATGKRALRDRLTHPQGLERMLAQSGLDWTVGTVIAASSILFLLALAFTIEVLRQTLPVGALVGLAASMLPTVYIRAARSRRLARLERQLPEALDLITRALRAGHAFSTGLKMAGDDLPQPIAGEFRAVSDEINFGVSTQQALTHLAERVPLMDVRYFTVAVLIQRESGGNLTEVLSDLAALIRERAKLMGRIRVLSTEGRLSAWILCIMPFALTALIYAFNPEFMRVLWTDPIGIGIVKTMLLLMAFGAFWMRRIIRVRV